LLEQIRRLFETRYEQNLEIFIAVLASRGGVPQPIVRQVLRGKQGEWDAATTLLVYVFWG